MQNNNSLLEIKLKSSGLDLDDAEQLGLEFITNAAELHWSFWDVPAVKIPYLNTQSAGFYRMRRLGEPLGYGGGKSAKYLQEPGTGVSVYFPNFDAIDWPLVKKNVDNALIITEGELKAAKACKDGFLTIGLGGVNSFVSKASGGELIPDLKSIAWAKRHVYIVYDSDVVEKVAVNKALVQLAIKLEALGAFVYTVVLPELVPGKCGLDDFLLSQPREILAQLLKVAWPISMTRELWAMNNRFIHIRKPNVVVDQATLLMYSYIDFKNGVHTPQLALRNELVRGELKASEISIGRKWLEWPLHTRADAMTYNPGGVDFEVDSQTGICRYNMWKGWAVEPEPGDIEPFLQLFDHVFDGADEEFKHWVMQWFAYPFQYPGTKLYTALLVIGAEQGTGKSFIGEIVGGIYGDYTPETGRQGYMHSTNLRDDMFKSSFNGALGDKCFIRVEEVTGSDAYAEANKVKNMITQKTILINRKGIEAENRIDRLNYYITSNYIRAAKIETGDRRFAVHYVNSGKAAAALYDTVDSWFKDPECKGLKALLHYFMGLDLTGFNPRAPAPMTRAKAEVIEATQPAAEAWVRHVMENPAALKIGGVLSPDLMTTLDVLAYFEGGIGRGKGYTPSRIGAIMRDCGVKKANGGNKINVNGVRQVYYIMRNSEKWFTASHDKCRTYLEENVCQNLY